MSYGTSDLNRFFGMTQATKNGHNVSNDFRETGWEVVDWIHLAQDRDQGRAVVNTVMNLSVP
jgi:hypothetical protein